MQDLKNLNCLLPRTKTLLLQLIDLFHNQKTIASFIKDNRNFIIDYKDFGIKNSITLSLANTQKIYLYDYRFPPYLESFLPEEYLLSLVRKIAF